VAVKPRWLASRPIFDVLLSAGVGGHLRSMAVRLPHILTLMMLSWFSLAAFGVVSRAKAILCLPIVYFVAVLPISFQGLGTSQFMFIHFFAVYAPGNDRSALGGDPRSEFGLPGHRFRHPALHRPRLHAQPARAQSG
jgi:hypothetical protein